MTKKKTAGTKKSARKKVASKKKPTAASVKKPTVKKERKLSDGKRQTLWMSESLKKRVLSHKKFQGRSFSSVVAEALQKILK